MSEPMFGFYVFALEVVLRPTEHRVQIPSPPSSAGEFPLHSYAVGFVRHFEANCIPLGKLWSYEKMSADAHVNNIRGICFQWLDNIINEYRPNTSTVWSFLYNISCKVEYFSVQVFVVDVSHPKRKLLKTQVQTLSFFVSVLTFWSLMKSVNYDKIAIK